MASLKAKFTLFDGFSTVFEKFIRKSDEATDKILKASGATDKFNTKLGNTEVSASKASSGLTSLIGKVITVAGALKGMSIADEFMNTSTRLDLINDGLQTQEELQNKIFSSADRAKGSYKDMAGAISKMGLLAGDSFTSNDELIYFTELLQKSFKIGGASQSEQSSALLQLTQSMAAGKLQGDEFRSIMENAPMVADAIAKYTGKSKGELKELSSQGLITSDIIKNAMFDAAGGVDGINARFNKMPKTFADVWNEIKNGATKAFAPLIVKVNQLINTDEFQSFINGLITSFQAVAGVTSWLIDVIIDGWAVIGPILGMIAGVYLAYMIGQLWAMVSPLIAQAVAWMAVYWPILLVIAIIGLAIIAARKFGASWEEIFQFIGGVVGVYVTSFYNRFVRVWNFVAAFANFIGNVFSNPIASIQVLFLDLATNVLGFIGMIAKGIEELLNKIPGVKVDITSGITNLKDELSAKATDIRSEAELKTYMESKEFVDFSDGFSKGSEMGKEFANSIGDAFGGINDIKDLIGSPLTVEGTGASGAVNVNMSDEDLQYLRDIAERDYINKFSTATLAPNVVFNISDIKETADINELKGKLEMMMREEIAIAAEGAY